MSPFLRKMLVAVSGGRLGRRLVSEANAARDRADWSEAEQLYRQALARKPGLSSVLVQLGYVANRSGRPRDALAIWYDYLRRPEAGREPHANLLAADLLAESGNPAAAGFHYDRASAGLGRRRPFADVAGATGTDAALGALAACEADLRDLDRLVDCADRLDGLGFSREAGLLRDVAALRRGRARPSMGDTLAEVRRDLADMRAALPAGPLSSDTARFLSVAAARSPDSATTSFAPDDMFDQSIGVVMALRKALDCEDAAAADLDTVLQRIKSDLVEAPPLASLGANETVAMRAGRVAWNSLRHFVLRHRFLAYSPTGSGALLRAAAGCSWAGLGPYLDGASRLLGSGRDVFGWLSLAWSEQDEVSTDLIEVGAVLLGSQLRLTPTNDFVEELGDLGLIRAVGGILSHRLACGDATRLLLERARDAYLDADAAALARDAQSVISADWRDDPIEQSILADLRAMAERGVQPADRDLLEQRFARDTRRRSLRLARKAKAASGVLDFSAEAEALTTSIGSRGLAPEIAPVAPHPEELTAGIQILHLGWRKSYSHWGPLVVLRGIEAVRIRCTSWHPVPECELFLDGRRIARGRNDDASGPEDAEPPFRFIFNLWIDLTATAPGPHMLDVVCFDVFGNQISRRRRIQVEEPHPSEAGSLSDAAVFLPGLGDGVLEDRINAQPSVIRSAGRSFLDALPRRVLVVRADQLGDFVASVPAIRRLQEMLPAAEFYALVTPANETLARSLGIFTDVITAELAYSHATRRRHMSVDRQAILRDRLVALNLGLAIDLSPGPDSRPLLKLSGASHLMGFRPVEFPWLSFGIDVRTHDRVNGKEKASHATVVLSLIEAIGATLRSRFATFPEKDIARDILERFGLACETRFVVLHAGARIDFKRWPLDNYIDLAGLIVERTDLNVVLLSDHAADGDRVCARGISPDRLSFAGGNLPFDEFEALIGFCDVFVGNDTGPKHLAALRGAKVVSVHMGQVNWDEWGQEGNGLIVSRRVPCCGCGIDRITDCGKDLACLVHIRPDEVFDAVKRLLHGSEIGKNTVLKAV